MLSIFNKLFEYFFGERNNFVQFSENIYCGNLKKNRAIYYNEEKRVTI